MTDSYKPFMDVKGDPAQFEPVNSKAGSEVRKRRLSPAQDWFKREMIDKEALVAAQRFAKDYEESALKPRYTSSSWGVDRVSGGEEAPDQWFMRQKAAGSAFLAAIEAIPPRARPASEALLAQELSVREYASGGVQAAEARTLALIGLDALVLHYDHVVSRR